MIITVTVDHMDAVKVAEIGVTVTYLHPPRPCKVHSPPTAVRGPQGGLANPLSSAGQVIIGAPSQLSLMMPPIEL